MMAMQSQITLWTDPPAESPAPEGLRRHVATRCFQAWRFAGLLRPAWARWKRDGSLPAIIPGNVGSAITRNGREIVGSLGTSSGNNFWPVWIRQHFAPELARLATETGCRVISFDHMRESSGLPGDYRQSYDGTRRLVRDIMNPLAEALEAAGQRDMQLSMYGLSAHHLDDHDGHWMIAASTSAWGTPGQLADREVIREPERVLRGRRLMPWLMMPGMQRSVSGGSGLMPGPDFAAMLAILDHHPNVDTMAWWIDHRVDKPAHWSAAWLAAKQVAAGPAEIPGGDDGDVPFSFQALIMELANDPTAVAQFTLDAMRAEDEPPADREAGP